MFSPDKYLVKACCDPDLVAHVPVFNRQQAGLPGFSPQVTLFLLLGFDGETLLAKGLCQNCFDPFCLEPVNLEAAQEPHCACDQH
jgi:hypothetical protein